MRSIPFFSQNFLLGALSLQSPSGPFHVEQGVCLGLEEDRGFVPSTHRKAGVLGSEPGCRAPRDCADLATGCQGAVPPKAHGPSGSVSLFPCN